MEAFKTVFSESFEEINRRSTHELIEIVFHLLRISNFVFGENLPISFIESLYAILIPRLQHNNVTFNDNIQIQMIDNPIINTCDDQILKLSFLRENVKEITPVKNGLVYKKLKYHFDNVFTSDNMDIVKELKDFINTRVTANKEVNIILCGYSSSGKSTISSNLIDALNIEAYELYQIYLNKVFVYADGIKRILNIDETIHDPKFIFTSTCIKHILQNFCIKSSTEANICSSRSHTIIICHIRNETGNLIKISILDLAGFERSKKKLFTRESQESLYINKSLFNITRFMLDNKYKDNKCVLLNFMKNVKNICFILMFHDLPEFGLYSCNHLVMLKDLYKITKFK